NEFVARFIGDPPMNFFDCNVVSREDRPAIRFVGHELPTSGSIARALSGVSDGRVRVGVRPADITIARSTDLAALSSEVLVVEPSERTLVVTLRADRTDFKLKSQAGHGIRAGDRIQVRFDPTKLYVFDPVSGLTLTQKAPVSR